MLIDTRNAIVQVDVSHNCIWVNVDGVCAIRVQDPANAFLVQRNGIDLVTPTPLTMRQHQINIVKDAINRWKGDKILAADELNISVKTIYNILKEDETSVKHLNVARNLQPDSIL